MGRAFGGSGVRSPVASLSFDRWEEGRPGHTRYLDWLVHEEIVFAGISKNGRGRREHVVPLKVIYDRCEAMFDAGAAVDEVAAFIGKHLCVVHITEEEAQRLDRVLGLKQRMPDGWKFGDDVFARLKAA